MWLSVDIGHLQQDEKLMSYPKITICSPAFFSKERLIQYELDDENDDVANYLILSLQFDPMIPAIYVRNIL